MNFRIRRRADDVEINFVPLIDVLVVLLIFLMVTTTFAHLGALGVDLPGAQADQAAPVESVVLAISAGGDFSVDDRPLAGRDRDALAQALRAATAGRNEPRLVVSADRRTAHEWVVLAMEAARAAGIGQLSFAVAATPP